MQQIELVWVEMKGFGLMKVGHSGILKITMQPFGNTMLFILPNEKGFTNRYYTNDFIACEDAKTETNEKIN